MLKKEDLQVKGTRVKVSGSVYGVSINVILKGKQNVKIDTGYLKDYIEDKILKGEFVIVEQPKGNKYARIELI